MIIIDIAINAIVVDNLYRFGDGNGMPMTEYVPSTGCHNEGWLAGIMYWGYCYGERS